MKGDFKKCTGCGEEKPATAEYFYREKGGKGGLRAACKDCAAAHHKKWREENPEKVKAASRKWNEANPEKVVAKYKRYREKNREALYAWQREDKKRRRKEDPIFRLLANMRTGLWGCLSGKQKNSPTFDYIDLTPEELMDYLEGQFTEGMTRENYGEWHVDHIRPLASFDFTGPDKEEQLHAAWSHTNMQPLWASDNIRKGARYEEGSLL